LDEPAKNYDLGLAYLAAARKIAAAAWRLQSEDREQVRRVADGLVATGTRLLTSVIRPRGKGARPTPPSEHERGLPASPRPGADLPGA
jgi:hypothetical protein